MPTEVAIIYNQPLTGRYGKLGEEKAELGVLDEVEAVYHALTETGYVVSQVPLLPPLAEVRNKLSQLKADVVYNLFEGFDGRPETEAMVADMLSELGLTFTGCPGKALALALDKLQTKTLFDKAGIATPGYQMLEPETLSQFRLTFPCIVKPCGEDASHGLSEESVVSDFKSLERQVRKISRDYGGKAMVEEFLEGREFNITVLGNESPAVLPVSEIVYSLPPGLPRILTFAAKWETDSVYYQGTEPECPANLGEDEREKIAQLAISAFKLLGCRGYARVDLRMDKDGRPEVLELNPNPDISLTSGAARQAKAAGMTYNQFIEKIVLLALEPK